MCLYKKTEKDISSSLSHIFLHILDLKAPKYQKSVHARKRQLPLQGGEWCYVVISLFAICFLKKVLAHRTMNRGHYSQLEMQFRRVCLLHLYLRPTAASPATFRSPWRCSPCHSVIDVGVAWVIRQLLTHPTRIILLHVCLASVLCFLEDINSPRWRTQIKFKKFPLRLRG